MLVVAAVAAGAEGGSETCGLLLSTQAKAVELQRSEAALRGWLEEEHARKVSATEARTPRDV
jgi:hypothetical protein